MNARSIGIAADLGDTSGFSPAAPHFSDTHRFSSRSHRTAADASSIEGASCSSSSPPLPLPVRKPPAAFCVAPQASAPQTPPIAQCRPLIGKAASCGVAPLYIRFCGLTSILPQFPPSGRDFSTAGFFTPATRPDRNIKAQQRTPAVRCANTTWVQCA